MAAKNIAAAGTSAVPKVLVSTQISVTTDSAVYTCPGSSSVKIANASISNVSAAAVTIGVSIVMTGGTVGDGTHKVIPDTYTLAAGDTLPLAGYLAGHVLGDGDVIAMKAGTANAVDVVISGTVFS